MVGIGGGIQWFSIGLTVYGIAPQSITAILGDPTDSSDRPRHARNQQTPPLREPVLFWSRAVRPIEAENEPIASGIRRLFDGMDCSWRRWGLLPADCDARLSIGALLVGFNQGFDIDSDLLRFLAERHIMLSVDLYNGEDE